MTVEINEVEFDTFVGSRSVALIDFYATWCGPCTTMAPVIDQIAQKYAGKVAVGKVDVVGCPDVAERFGVSSIPTFGFFKDGQLVESICGAVTPTTLEAQLDKLLAK